MKRELSLPFSSNRRLSPWASACLLLWFSAATLAAGCPDQARSELEKLFCKVQQSGEGKGLPSFEDFRRNTPQVQALLLKRPAERLGLAVPKNLVRPNIAAAPRPTDTNKEATKALPSASRQNQAKPNELSAPIKAAARSESKPERGLSGCVLAGEQINCGERRFHLVNNQDNRHLAAGALGPQNRFGLASFSGNPNDAAALKSYLGNAYRHYIDKMLAIGLGASTMSYTKFYYTFEEVQAKGEDFAARFETMYDYLKKDKAGMGIKARYDNSLPSALDQCVDLNAQLIVCDNGARNWIFAKP